jgi:hypothetical protein
MARVACPRCGVLRLMSESEWGNEVQCNQPRCGHWFLAPTTRPVVRGLPSPPSLPRPQRRETILTSPHVCFTCRGLISQPTGWRRCQVRHRRPAVDDQPAGPECLMSVYAAIYYCPRCPAGTTLLETPSYACGRGQEATCPRCRGSFRAPWYDLLHETVGDHCEGEIICFHCPACQGELQTDTRRNGQLTVGLPVACLHCSTLIELPPSGHSPKL